MTLLKVNSNFLTEEENIKHLQHLRAMSFKKKKIKIVHGRWSDIISRSQQLKFVHTLHKTSKDQSNSRSIESNLFFGAVFLL